ncbi:hypothetical protein [Sphingomicrobium lutaoense]|uniref:17 kDa surface antigen n=1 Tax=Sphingomicrobium lutaoense TaxID=515949 RepID=A0A839Z3J9_9SPHN|nr:hypothetical protein [Sphingomicrobium lutaoense]MBB3764393.1 hypothetical protein [Sphingomicrobium lutaoense]
MSIKKKLFIGAAGLTAAAGMAAVPAQAQYYPNSGYNNNNTTGQVVGAIIRGILGAGNYGSYPYGNYGYGDRYGYGMSERTAVDRCARAVEARLNHQGRYGAYDRYNSRYDRYGYDNYRGHARVAGITDVRRKSYGLKVYGVAMSGHSASQYDRYNRHGYGYNTAPDLKWDCKIDRSGRIRDIDIERNDRRYRRY